MDNKILNKTITLSEINHTKTQAGKAIAKVKDEKGLTYNVPQLKKDGSQTKAWGQLKQLDIGTLVYIGYTEYDGEWQGKKYIGRQIISFDTDIANGQQNAQNNATNSSQATNTQPNTQTAHTGANLASQDKSVDWDKLGYAKTLSNWIGGFLAVGEDKDFIKGFILNNAWDYYQLIGSEADKRFSPTVSEISKTENISQDILEDAKRAEAESLPVIQQGDDVDVDDIPY